MFDDVINYNSCAAALLYRQHISRVLYKCDGSYFMLILRRIFRLCFRARLPRPRARQTFIVRPTPPSTPTLLLDLNGKTIIPLYISFLAFLLEIRVLAGHRVSLNVIRRNFLERFFPLYSLGLDCNETQQQQPSTAVCWLIHTYCVRL